MPSHSSSSPARKSPTRPQRSRSSSASSKCLRSRKRSCSRSTSRRRSNIRSRTRSRSRSRRRSPRSNTSGEGTWARSVSRKRGGRKRATRRVCPAKRSCGNLAGSASTKKKREAKPSILTDATMTRLQELGCTLTQDPKDMVVAVKQRICNAEKEIVALQRRLLADQNASVLAAAPRPGKGAVGSKNAAPDDRTHQTGFPQIIGAVAKVRGSSLVPPKCTAVPGPPAANSTCRWMGSSTVGHSPAVQPGPGAWSEQRAPLRPWTATPGFLSWQLAPSQPLPVYARWPCGVPAPRVPQRPPPPYATQPLSAANFWSHPQVIPPIRPSHLGETELHWRGEQAYRAAIAGAVPKSLSLGSVGLVRPRWGPVVNKPVVQFVSPQDKDGLDFEVQKLLSSGNYDQIPEIKLNDLRSHLRDMLEMDQVESPPSVFTAFYGEVEDDEDDESNEDMEETEQKGQVDENEHAETKELQSSEQGGEKGEETTRDEESKGIEARTSLVSIPPASRDSVILASAAAAATVVSAARVGSPDAAELAAGVEASGDHDKLSIHWDEEEALSDLSPISEISSEHGVGVHETTAQLPLPHQARNYVTGDAEAARDAVAQEPAQAAEELQNTIGVTSSAFSEENGSQRPAASLRSADARGGTEHKTQTANNDEATATAPAPATDAVVGSPQLAAGACTIHDGGVPEQNQECVNDDKAAATGPPSQGRKRKMRSVILTPSWREGAMAAVELMLKRRLEAAAPGEEIELALRQIKYSQESIKGSFRDGRTIRQMRRELAAGWKRIEQIPKIQAVVHDGCVYSADNRRLWAFKHVGMPQETRIPVVVGAKTPHFFRKLTTPTFGRSLRKRGETGGIY